MKSATAKPGRRITLTPLPFQPPSLSTFSTPNSSPGSCWKSNPAFANHFTASEATAPSSSLSEERRMLKEERSRWRQKHGNKMTSSSLRPSSASASDKPSMSSGRGQQVKGQSSSSPLEGSGIDEKIATHSIFQFSSSSRGRNTSTNSSSLNYSSKMDPSYQDTVSGQRSISTLSSISSTSHPPLTSTPPLSMVVSRGCGQSACQTSLLNVTHRDSLDLLSNHYADLINSESHVIHVQWSLSTEDNIGTAKSVLIKWVSSF